jgi:hypothetical protein
LGAQGKVGAAEAALLNGIAAHPGQLPTWTKLANIRKAAGTPLEPLHLTPKAKARLDPATGKYTLEVNTDDKPGMDPKNPNLAIWMTLALGEANLATDRSQGKPPLSPYAIRLTAWKDALKAADEIAANTGKEIDDPGLKAMQMLAKADQLEPAVLLLQYRESYRPELESWKAAHPNGVKKFIDTYGLRP